MNPNGNGLGLSICKNLAKCLNGDLTMTSEWGIGSCFTFVMELLIVKNNKKKTSKKKEIKSVEKKSKESNILALKLKPIETEKKNVGQIHEILKEEEDDQEEIDFLLDQMPAEP